MLLYNTAIDTLIENFPELKSTYNSEIDYYKDLPYVFYEAVFTKRIIEAINNNSELDLVKVFSFVEKILHEGDEEFRNLVDVAILESLFFEKIFDDKGYPWSLLGKLSKESIEKCNK